MRKREQTRINIISPLLLLFIHHQTSHILVNAGAPSPPKNLVDPYTHSPNDNTSINLNASSSKQFQNGYPPFRQGKGGFDTLGSYKSTTSPPETTIADHSSSLDMSSSDYYYQDNRGMTTVPDCKGRLKLSGTRGYITDGPGHYQTNLQCVWLIDSGRLNATIRLQVHQFNTECNYDFLYIFDGDSIYSPLVAALSGDMRDFGSSFVDTTAPEHLISNLDNNSSNISPNNKNSASTHFNNPVMPVGLSESRPLELKATSGKAFVYFHSDTAQSMPGFYLTYSIDTCPLDCSNKGECDYSSLKCKCYTGHYGTGCQYTLCPNNCTSPIHGRCDQEKSCVCNKGYYGLDCSDIEVTQMWQSLPEQSSDSTLARAFHQAIVVNETMWIIGGKTQAFSNTNMGIFRRKPTQMVLSFDIANRSWTDNVIVGTTGIDHLAELSGHSVAADGNRVYVYGGSAMNNSVLDALTVLDTSNNSLYQLFSYKKTHELMAPVATVGHSAIIVDGIMYVLLGYNPHYGYLNFVQKYEISTSSWSILPRRGSSVSGRIGHSCTLDNETAMVYVYGGHNAFRSNKLYAFDLKTESWTFLQPGSSPRYYHSAAILDRQLIIFGGNSYSTAHQSDQCFHKTYLTYDLSCSEPLKNDTNLECPRKCWQSIDDNEPGVLKRHGHSIVAHGREIVLYGGFNGVVMDDIRFMDIGSCDKITDVFNCVLPKLALNCRWNLRETKCENRTIQSQTSLTTSEYQANRTCSSALSINTNACEGRETCSDCLNTNLGCVWCGNTLSRCQYGKCKSFRSEPIRTVEACFRDSVPEVSKSVENRNTTINGRVHFNQLIDYEMDCKVDNCWLCHSRSYCSWQNDGCVYNAPSTSLIPPPYSPSSQSDDGMDMYDLGRSMQNNTHLIRKLDPLNKSIWSALTNSSMDPWTFHDCEAPCYKRHSCNECTTTKCIWCSTTEQCIDSTAYFAYHAIGQCMHYVAHMLKCPIASCSDIETCDKCLTNPRCGWLNDISNTGKGRCIEGNSSSPSFSNALIEGGSSSSPTSSSISLFSPTILTNWHYSSCPACQCNGHSYCKGNSSICMSPCQDNTDGEHCDKCIQGYHGDPINGGSCRPCRCNGHAHTCNRETGRCYCSTKGITGHNCDRCDEKNYYSGDPLSSGNGTCYYNLTTDYQYTFNMSKPEDLFYNDINFINLPLRKDSDVDFTIGCSRLALVNITAGTSYKTRRPLHTNLECGSFRLRFAHERHGFSDSNYSFFVHVYKFQTPFVLHVAFSQHRTFYLPQFFLTFSR